MLGFLATLKTKDGLVVISDSEGISGKITGYYMINAHTVAMFYFDEKQATEFCKQYLSGFSSGGSLNEIVETAFVTLQKIQDQFKGKSFSIAFASINETDSIRNYHVIWIQDNKAVQSPVFAAGVYTLMHQDLAGYIISKVYSKHMSITQATNLIGYVLLQCNKVFKTDYSVDMAILSHDGLQKLTDVQLHDILSKAENVDHQLLRAFSNFFVNEAINK